MTAPDDNRPYDPLAEAIGWLVLAGAELEFWLNVIAARIEARTYPDAVWISSGEKARLLHELDPDLGSVGERILDIVEIRNTLAHGVAHHHADRSAIDLQVQPTSRHAPYRKLRLTREDLIALADEAHDIASRLQLRSS